jgi:glycosyltransferase involved in cell wall biosynthesis
MDVAVRPGAPAPVTPVDAGKPLDLLFLAQTYPRFAGDGAGPFIRDLARALARGGDRVTVLVPHAAGLALEPEPAGVEVLPFRYAPERWELLGYGRSLAADERPRAGAALAAPLYLLAARRAIAAALRRRHYDLVHAHWIIPNGVAAPSLPRRYRARFAIGLHGSDVFLAEKPAVRPLARRALARADLLTGCSPELVSRIVALGFPPERARVIPYGVDVRAFSPDPAARSAWRERLGIPAAAPLVLGVGRMATKKGFQVLFAALPDLLAAFPDVHVVLAGGGDLLAGFRAAAAAWPRVHLPGPVLHGDLPDLYRAADLFVLPAVHDRNGNVDGLPNVILEAMATGLPVVATQVSGIPLAVASGDEEETGILVPEGDAAALGRALAALLANPERARAMGERGRRRTEALLTWDAVAARYREGYLAALAAPRRPL